MTLQQLTERRQQLEAEIAEAREKERQHVEAAKQQSALIHTLNGALQENAHWLQQAQPGKLEVVKPNGADLTGASEIT